SVVAIIGVIMTSKVFLNHKGSGSKVLRDKIKEHEDYEKYLKKMNTFLQRDIPSQLLGRYQPSQPLLYILFQQRPVRFLHNKSLTGRC
ncbi:hypothetical protein, partial [Desulfobacula sp.]|uniref:hypothetical protein n=1 Tax=Desulfobacula sp. TaxID=2593537 RepID=UPI0039B83C54